MTNQRSEIIPQNKPFFLTCNRIVAIGKGAQSAKCIRKILKTEMNAVLINHLTFCTKMDSMDKPLAK
jgi:hypothetical protein